MAIDRYLVVCHHTFSRNYYSGLKGPRILVAASYIFSFILATPQVFIFSYMDVPDSPGIRDCWVTFIEPWGQKAYVTFFVVCAFIFPLMVIGVSYGAICCKVIRFSLPKEGRAQKQQKERRKKKYSFSSSSAGTRDEQETDSVDEAPLRKTSEERGALRRQISQAKMKTLKLTLTVVICFFVCWAPFSITQLVIAYNPQNAGPLQVIFLLLASLNSCTNPWIYLAFSESLCNQLRVSLGFGLRRASDDESIGDEKEIPELQAGRKPQKEEKAMEKGRTGPGKKTPAAALSDNRTRNGEQVQPETKSDVV
ncbi:Vasopressin V1a receptor [Orchesella cincta]|uniref:Vasopressin V1a receptor n=1 Tax=Orchesella cincta TaxID=48709 RepID=A0A1D2M998_ORCCI|nr:Vasopressin V1a receptor [Orchesella cincta]